MSNKNNSKLIKRLITGALCLTLVFSINGFASVVSDNDGSAFITKAEFDSLKNNFQAQIDQYNTSIDSKIDGAIAAYLAGIKVQTTSLKKCLVNAYDRVALFTDSTYSYQYARPTWNAFAYSNMTNVTQKANLMSPNTTDANWPVNSACAVSWQKVSVGYSLDDDDNGCKEMVIDKLILESGETSPLKYFLRGYFVNVHYSYLSITNLLYTPADINYAGISKSYVLGVVPNNITMRYQNGVPDSQPIAKGVFWNYTLSTHGALQAGGDWYGPLNMVTQGFENSVLNGSIDYHNDLATDKSPLDNTYFIAYDDTKKFVNFYNMPYYWALGGQINTASTETLMEFAKLTEVGGKGEILYAFGSPQNPWLHNTVKANFNATQKANFYTDNYENYAVSHSISSDEMALEGNMPIFSGFEESAPSEIRQMDDKFTSAELPELVVKNLSIIAGLPLCIEKQGSIVEWKPKFVDTTKKYRLWFSYTPFEDKPQVDTTGLQRILFNGNKYIDIDNGTGTVRWEMSNDSPVYVKWAELNGSTETAAGVLNLKECNSYITIMAD